MPPLEPNRSPPTQRRSRRRCSIPARATPAIVAGPRGKAAVKRYNVYRNNVTVSLIDALAAIYPAVQRITGVDFFRAMARFHVRATPPTSPLLFEYGRDFPAFIEHYEYARAMPWLADTARIERAWLDAYHAADAEPLSADALAAVPARRLADVVFIAHPATRIVRSRFSAVTIFAANRSDGAGRPIDAASPEDALITRPDLDVVVRHLPPGGAVFLTSLMSGQSLGEAAASALDASPCFRHRRQHRRDDRGRRFHRRHLRRSTMIIDQHCGAGEPLRHRRPRRQGQSPGSDGRAPSLVQLVMRVALAVPFWKSGILKWTGFLQAQRHRGDAVHRRVHAASAGRALSLSGADGDGVPVRMRRDHVSGAAGTGPCARALPRSACCS